MSQPNFVGIDVGSKSLVLKIEDEDQKLSREAEFNNTSAGHKKLEKFITKKGRQAIVCMEATGVYHFSLALHLHHAKNVTVMVANPRAIKHFAIAMMKRAKTDRLDAEVILRFLKVCDFVPWEPPANHCLLLQRLGRRMHQLKTDLTREQNRLHADESRKTKDRIIDNDINVNIRHLKKRIATLEAKALETINADESLKRDYTLICSAKGIAKTSGIQIFSELVCMPKDMESKEWVAHAGLDPRAVESGESMNKPRRISKAGNKYLRAALYMPAWVAVQRDAHVRAYYNKLVKKGKKKMQAITAVMRKLLVCLWGMLHHGKEWDSKKFYLDSVSLAEKLP